MTEQLTFGDAVVGGRKTFYLNVQDGLGWREILDADSPEELLDTARTYRQHHRDHLIAIRSRNPNHDSFVKGWLAGSEVKGLKSS